jgi:hypothetical protein
MFFQESEAIAHESEDLRPVIEQVDEVLSGIASPDPLRPGDFASVLGAEENQVVSVFELLAQKGVLSAEAMVECERCQNLMSADAFHQAIDDEDDFECTQCGRVFSTRSEPILIYRMTTETLRRFESPVSPSANPVRAWPNPKERTTAKFWTRKDGALRLSTKTDGQHDGMVEFAPTESGEMTFQMRFMQLLSFKFPTPVSLAEVIEQVYRDDYATAKGNATALGKTLRKLRTLVSDIRNRKLAAANLNPDILPSLSIEAPIDTGIALRLAHLHRLDDKDLDDADEAVP